MIRLVTLTLVALSVSGCAGLNQSLADLDNRLQGRAISPPSVAAPKIVDAAKIQTVQNLGLESRIRLDIPKDKITVIDGVNHVIAGLGYSVELYCGGCPTEAPRIAYDPISPLAFAKPGEITTVERALIAILGSDARIVVDHNDRLISFEHRDGGSII